MASLHDRANLLGAPLSPDKLGLLRQYLQELERYNEHTNLVSNAAPEVVVTNHVLEALTLVPVLEKTMVGDKPPASLIDIGSGAGFPGLVLAVVVDRLRVCLVDSIGKKTRFLTECVRALNLQSRVQVQTARAEDLARQPAFRAKFDVATARAVGVVGLIAELTLPLVHKGGYLIAQKSRQQFDKEIADAEPVLHLLGAKLESVQAPNAEAFEKDVVIAVIRKEVETPERFPRPTAQLKKPIA